MRNNLKKTFTMLAFVYSLVSTAQNITAKLLLYGCDVISTGTGSVYSFCNNDSMQTNILLNNWDIAPDPRLKLTQNGDTLRLSITDSAAISSGFYCRMQFKVRYYGNLKKDYYLFINDLPMYTMGCSKTAVNELKADSWKGMYELKNGKITINRVNETNTRISNLLGEILISTNEKEIEINSLLDKQSVLVIQVEDAQHTSTRKILKIDY